METDEVRAALDYFPFYHSYREKLAKLSDQELGRLVRALLDYSITGERQELAGREDIAYGFICYDVDRARASYRARCNTNARNGKKGGRPPKNTTGSEDPVASSENPAVFPKTEKSQYKDKNKHKNNYDNNDDDDDGHWRADAADTAVAVVTDTFLKKINATPSQTCLAELRGFVGDMGADCCLRAIDIALDAGNANWRYIRGILRAKRSQGVCCLADWDKLEAKWQHTRSAPPAADERERDRAADIRESDAWMDAYLAKVKEA